MWVGVHAVGDRRAVAGDMPRRWNPRARVVACLVYQHASPWQPMPPCHAPCRRACCVMQTRQCCRLWWTRVLSWPSLAGSRWALGGLNTAACIAKSAASGSLACGVPLSCTVRHPDSFVSHSTYHCASATPPVHLRPADVSTPARRFVRQRRRQLRRSHAWARGQPR